jgi:ATP-dependent RNA helicase DeaD
MEACRKELEIVSWNNFVKGHINILVATDLAARGIDVKEISYVVNYHLPDALSNVHRSGRTARAGARDFH